MKKEDSIVFPTKINSVTMMMIGTSIYSLSDAFIKIIMPFCEIEHILFYRSLFRTIPFFLLYFFIKENSLTIKNKKLFLLRILFNLCNTYCFAKALYELPSGYMTLISGISQISPIITIILSSIILKDTIAKDKILSVLVCIAGAYLIINPISYDILPNAVYAFLGAFTAACNQITTKKLTSSESTLSIVIYPNIIMSIIVFLQNPCFYKNQPTNSVIFVIFCIGIFMSIGQYLIANAIKFGKISNITQVNYFALSVNVSIDFFIFNKTPVFQVIFGAFMILIANVYIINNTNNKK